MSTQQPLQQPTIPVQAPEGAHTHWCWHHNENYTCLCPESKWIHRLCDSCEIRLGRNLPQQAAQMVDELPEPELSDNELLELEMLLSRDHDDAAYWIGGAR
jgi:hypothetical protein